MLWGDDLYDRGDYRTAADAYYLALEAADNMTMPPEQPGLDPRWAKFRRAGALLELRDFGAGLPLLDEVAETDAPWASEARTQAEMARLEQRLQNSARTAEG